MSKPQRSHSNDMAADQVKKKRNYKLLVDPELRRDATKKVYRFDGCVPGHSPIPPPRDPRAQKTILGGSGKTWNIPVPRFKFDRFSVCDPPQWEVLITGLTPNITSTLLKGTFTQVGPISFVKIHKNVNGGQSLGAASICFKRKGDGQVAVDTMNGFQLYGCTLKVQLDDQSDKARQFLRQKLDASKEENSKKPLSLSLLSTDDMDRVSDRGINLDGPSSLEATPRSEDWKERSNSLTSPITPSSAGLSTSSRSFQHFPVESRTTPTQALISPTTPLVDTPNSLDSGVSVSVSGLEQRMVEVSALKAPRQTLMMSSLLVSSVLQIEHRSPQLGDNVREQPSCQEHNTKLSLQKTQSKYPSNKTTSSSMPAVVRTETHDGPHTSAVSPISDISDMEDVSPDVVDTTNSCKFVNTFRLNTTASSGYSLATFDPSVSLQALLTLKKVTGASQKAENMEIEDISGDESPEVVVNDVPVESGGGDTCEDMELSDMECDSPTDTKIEVGVSLPVKPASNPSSYPIPLMGFDIKPYPSFPLPPPPLGTFPNPSHPPRGFPQHPPPPFLFPIPPPGPPPFLPPIAPTHSTIPVEHKVSKSTEKTSSVQQEHKMKRQSLAKDLKDRIMSQLKDVLLKDLQKKYINVVGTGLVDRHWDDLQKSQKSSLQSGTAAKPSSEPYRRMLDSKAKSMLAHDSHLTLPGTKRNRLVNFKIPTISREGSRRSGGVITMRRSVKDSQDRPLSPLYSDFSSSDSEGESEKNLGEEVDTKVPPVAQKEQESEEEEEQEKEEDYYESQPGEDELSSASEFSTLEEEDEEEESDISSEVDADKDPLVLSVKAESKVLSVSAVFSDSEDNKSVDLSSDVMETARDEEPTMDMAKEEEKTPTDQTPLMPSEELVMVSSPPKEVASPSPVPSPVFGKRSSSVEDTILLSFLEMGPDREDIEMFRRAWSQLHDDCDPLVKGLKWSHYPSMIADPIVIPPPQKRRRHTSQKTSEFSHKSGSARSEGYYKIDAFAKKNYVTTTMVETVPSTDHKKPQKQVSKTSGRVNRAKQRRLASDFASAEISSDLIKYGHLKARKKMVRFARSSIHGWGLFALEKIPADEMVIEYVGEIIRSVTADEREHRYEAMGIGSSYLFRLDGESVIDATKRGGVARFINHCCDPNCYAKVIVIGSSKKIVIYSKRDIHANEEITYDYKFPIEDEKIPCLCGAPHCRGTLN